MQQATVVGSSPQEINLISCGPMTHISDIKLIRTDTTLDLSQKAEKVLFIPPLTYTMWDSAFESSKSVRVEGHLSMYLSKDVRGCYYLQAKKHCIWWPGQDPVTY
ncbi:hypothetical protein ACB092_02G016900 [Castanea dentata]